MAKISRRVSPSAATSSATTTTTTATTATTTAATTTSTIKIKPGSQHASQRVIRALAEQPVDPLRPAADAGITDRSSASPTPATPGGNRSSRASDVHVNYTAAADPPQRASATTASPYMTQQMETHNLTAAEYNAERARIREEFFATYDVMTGVRIAATLGGFFGLMVFLIVWKSRSSSNETLKVLKDPKMAAVAAVCMQEEEEREIQEAIVATGMSIYPDEYDTLVYRRQRMLSLGNVSAPPLLNRGYRCASVGGVGVGYSYLLEPPRRFSYSAVSAGGASGGGGAAAAGGGHLPAGRRTSGSESSRIFSNYPMGGSFGTDDYFVETEDELEHDEEYMQRDGTLLELQDETQAQHHKRTDSTRSKQGFLSVPMAGHDSRRSSAMTCCSTDSSYLERRTSAYTLGMSNLPPTLQRKLSTASRTSSIENWDYYYPDIQVIQPTPKASPCPSERSIHEPAPTVKSAKSAKATQAKSSSSGIVRKHSIVSYDPASAQAGRKQQIHSISADTVDVYPYNQALVGQLASNALDLGLSQPKPIQSAPPSSAHQAFHFSDSPSEELRLGVRRKLTLVELQGVRESESNNNSYPYTANAATATAAPAAANVTSSSISIDSTPVSLDKLNGSCSLGTVSAKALFNAEKRAPLASLSSFKISSLECQDSELRSLDEDSVFGLESAADTDDDMQQLSSDSEEQAAAAAQAAITAASQAAVPAPVESKPTPTMPQPQVQAAAGIEKRFSLGGGGGGGARARRPLLQRHRTISASSSDRVSLMGQPLQEFQGSGCPTTAAPLETHFGAVISQAGNKRAQLLQQHSDPQSLPTTTTTTTTTTTEEDTCSTMNTEVGLLEAIGAGGAGGESATHTQYSSLNTVISLGRSSPLMDNNFVCSSGSATNANNNVASTCNSQQQQAAQSQHQTQLPLTRLAHDHEPCASSISDSALTTRSQFICMPATLKELILGGGQQLSGVSKSAANLTAPTPMPAATSGAVMLELPLIRLPTEEQNDDEEADGEDEATAAASSSRSRSDEEESRDPSLPGTSRKWSKETLF